MALCESHNVESLLWSIILASLRPSFHLIDCPFCLYHSHSQCLFVWPGDTMWTAQRLFVCLCPCSWVKKVCKVRAMFRNSSINWTRHTLSHGRLRCQKLPWFWTSWFIIIYYEDDVLESIDVRGWFEVHNDLNEMMFWNSSIITNIRHHLLLAVLGSEIALILNFAMIYTYNLLCNDSYL